MLDAQLVVDRDALDGLVDGWDALAVASELPQMSPGWVLAWWRHLAPPSAELRAVAVRDGEQLVGLAHFHVDPAAHRWRLDYRLPGIELCAGLAPLALPGREWEVAEAIGATLAGATPRPDLVALEAMPLRSHWPVALRDGWPGRMRPTLRQYHVQGCPLVTLQDASFEQWLAAKSSNFRGQMRRLARQFAAAGGTTRVATAVSLHDDIAALMRLHAARWEGLEGESNLVRLAESVPAMFEDAGRALLDSGRFRLRMLELDGEPISAQLFLVAGETILYLNGGWDERHAKLKPSMLGLLDTVEEAFAHGQRRIDLGLGEQAYKQRFANGNVPVAWSILMPAGRRRPLTRLLTAPMLARYMARDAAKRGLSPQQADRLRALRGRVPAPLRRST